MRILPFLCCLIPAVSAAQDLELYLPEGMERRAALEVLDDDLGSGLSGAMPTALLDALVELQPERFGPTLRDGYRRYGFLFLRGRELPVGIVSVRGGVGLPAHQFNCFACHSGQGVADGERDRLIVGATNRQVDFTGWYDAVYRGLWTVVQGEQARLKTDSAETLGAAAGRSLVSAARRTRKRQGRCLGPLETVALTTMANQTAREVLAGKPEPPPPQHGPGRTSVQAAYRTLRFDLPGGPFAPIKPPDLFGVRYRETLLWTGNETYPEETPPAERIARNGMLVPWIQLHPLTRQPVPDALTLIRFQRYMRMGEVLAQAAPPPAPAPADRALFERGAEVFAETCTDCHGSYRSVPALTPSGAPGLRTEVVDYRERVLPKEKVGTDPTYTAISDAAFLQAFERTLLGRSGLFGGRVSKGYVARPLLGLRLRAPYLHNGSVPSLDAMLTPPADRPRSFSVFGQERNTRASGNAAQGHPFGTDLDPADKRALLAYIERL